MRFKDKLVLGLAGLCLIVGGTLVSRNQHISQSESIVRYANGVTSLHKRKPIALSRNGVEYSLMNSKSYYDFNGDGIVDRIFIEDGPLANKINLKLDISSNLKTSRLNFKTPVNYTRLVKRGEGYEKEFEIADREMQRVLKIINSSKPDLEIPDYKVWGNTEGYDIDY